MGSEGGTLFVCFDTWGIGGCRTNWCFRNNSAVVKDITATTMTLEFHVGDARSLLCTDSYMFVTTSSMLCAPAVTCVSSHPPSWVNVAVFRCRTAFLFLRNATRCCA